MGSRWLYVDTVTSAPHHSPDPPSSDSIGYGITSSAAIRDELTRRGVVLSRPQLPSTPETGYERARWVTDVYGAIVDAVHFARPDGVFLFHTFTTFPTVVRKALQDMGSDIPIVGYTHGSHWDPTDLYRFRRHPGLELADLANLHTLDRLLLVSAYMRDTLRTSIGRLSPGVATEVLAKSVVVGLPINIGLMEKHRSARRFDRTTIVFNHAPVESKRPEIFAGAMERVLPRYEVDLVITRRFAADGPGGRAIAELARRFGGRVRLGDDMPIDTYYETLWMSDLQVSTATHESLGVATLEAMYTHNCCLVPATGAYPEVVGDTPGALYPPGETELAQRLGYFIERSRERRAVARLLAERARAYAPVAVVDRIVKALADLDPAPGSTGRR